MVRVELIRDSRCHGRKKEGRFRPCHGLSSQIEEVGHQLTTQEALTTASILHEQQFTGNLAHQREGEVVHEG